MTKEYDPQRGRCVKWDDPQLAIPWPIKEAIVSEKDSKCPPLSQAETNFESVARRADSTAAVEGPGF